MSEWVIVPCKEADKPQLVTVCKAQWTYGESRRLPALVVHNIEQVHSFEQYVEEHWRQIVVAKSAGQVIGFGLGAADEIVGLGVLPAWWRHGVGRALMGQLEQGMRARQVKTVRLEVYEVNRQAVDFYRALGYRDSDAYVNHHWGLPVTLLIMTKRL